MIGAWSQRSIGQQGQKAQDLDFLTSHQTPAWLGGATRQSVDRRPGKRAAAAAPSPHGGPPRGANHVPPWLAAAHGQVALGASFGATASVGAKVGRTRVTASRVSGEIGEWNAASGIGWVKPASPIDHPDAAKNPKGLHLTAADVLPQGTVLSKGMQVTFFAFSEGRRLGAEKLMEYKGTLLGSAGSGPDEKIIREPRMLLNAIKGNLKGYGKGSAKGIDCHNCGQMGHMAKDCGKGSAKGIDCHNCGKMGHMAKDCWTAAQGKGVPGVWTKFDGRQGKGGGQHKGPDRRTPIPDGTALTGKVVEWKGTWGMLEPDEAIVHAAASKRKGRIFVQKKDVVEGAELAVGMFVCFNVYEDKNGLGAEECVGA